MLTGNKQRSKYSLKISCKGVISAKKKKESSGRRQNEAEPYCGWGD